jgi:hypothetical protein
MTGERTSNPGEKFCSSCGSTIREEAEICPNCGVRQWQRPARNPAYQKDSTTAMLLNGLMGFVACMGIGYFYAGSPVMAIAFLLFGWLLTILFWLTIWFFGLGLIFIPIYVALWIFSTFHVKSMIERENAEYSHR